MTPACQVDVTNKFSKGSLFMPWLVVLLDSYLRMFFNHFLEEVVGIESCKESLWILKDHIIELYCRGNAERSETCFSVIIFQLRKTQLNALVFFFCCVFAI